MKTRQAFIILACAAALALSGCSWAWGVAYHHAGGFGKQYGGRARYMVNGQEVAAP